MATQREVAAQLGIGSGAAACNQLHNLADTLEASRQLRNQVKQAE